MEGYWEARAREFGRGFAAEAGEGRLRKAVAAAHDEPLGVVPRSGWNPGESETWLPAVPIDRRDVPRSPAESGIRKRRHEGRRDHPSVRQGHRLWQHVFFRKVRAARNLAIVFLGAWPLQR